ncbi:UDP-3-O-(3-hydroxymyristoyl)glucosamine N-acyltransferase [Natronospirillum operosum]|uniref:UDP-3-O-acylglucosamine N-acyltransferase n=1 Tax=Natronospirillum operosum TaxID=2759953 RepID=A0A4Z0W945_9GAMM|nr:UDP-3-O-(3-hydroxymyristoyl)glucosamine N-acyltransferase [Natronospirillum operosum]TGG95129.1 UDP-3-O-(3-hydroxymyristoyl)glucosamine N-acyltransferase [Natronospirillum operosum]
MKQQREPNSLTLENLAEHVGGTVKGDPAYTIQGLATLDHAGPEHLSFVARNRFRRQAEASAAGALLVRPALADELGCHCILVDDPYLAYARISQLFGPPDLVAPGVHASAVVHPEASLGERCRIGAHVVIEAGAVLADEVEIAASCYVGAGVHIGTGTCLRPRVTLYPGVQIGRHCLLHSGAVIGADGFGFAPTEEGWAKIVQLGRVRIGDHVEIGANSAIDRGALDDTVIGDHVIIDNLVQIGHNAELGSGSAMAGQSGLAGSARVGRRVMIGGQSGVGGHLDIVDGVQLMGGTMVNKSLTEPGDYASAIPVQPANEWRRMVARLKQLSTLSDKVSELWNRSRQNKE